MKLKYILLPLLLISLYCIAQSPIDNRIEKDFNTNWKFYLGDTTNAEKVDFNDNQWRILNLPHDWSIETSFDEKSLNGASGGYLNGGIGWYRKNFILDDTYKGKNIWLDFDGIYRNSEVWVNGHYLGKRPYGYVPFYYDITKYIKVGKPNVIAVKVDNSQEPNSRWYSGAGIYRNVSLVSVNPTHFKKWGIYVTTPQINSEKATLNIQYNITNNHNKTIKIISQLYDFQGKEVSLSDKLQKEDSLYTTVMEVLKPYLWSVDKPYLYKLVSQLYVDGKLTDEITTNVGIRYFNFDAKDGFSLNGKPMKILGVCNHHDLGCLGSAVNKRAIERQLEILKAMGCNAIRTSHNTPAKELLALCDKMGFIVMVEAFDMWKEAKNKYDYSLDFDKWYEKDLTNQILRDRNHPSVFIWSVGNEIPEQNDSITGSKIMKDLFAVIQKYDKNRPIVTGNNHPSTKNPLITCGATDLIGINYFVPHWISFPEKYPNKKLIITESTSGLQTRGYYEMPSDSVRQVPNDGTYKTPRNYLSAYDAYTVGWGTTHEETWKNVKKYPHISGLFVWTGFDYIGEPTPYTWPSRSSYFGIVDLAGFPKDVYYMYQSEWKDTPVLHIFPHWNWTVGQPIDVWAYYNNADSVELFVNGKSQGSKRKTNDELHVMWRLNFETGILKAVSYKNGKVLLTKEIKTASSPSKIKLTADRTMLTADGKDLSFITITILDKDGNILPNAENLVQLNIEGAGKIVGVDNGSQINLESFKSEQIKAFFGKCLVVIQSTNKKGKIKLIAKSNGLTDASITIATK